MTGGWWAHSQEQAHFWLVNQGFTDIRLRPSATRPADLRVRGQSLALFYRQLAVMFPNGVPLTEALRLTSYSEDRNLGAVCLHLGEQIQNGHSLSQAMRLFPRVFDPVVVGLMAASESSGRLAQTLKRLADTEERRYKLVRAAIAALTYPALLSLSTFALAALFFLYIFPINQELFSSMNLELPLLNRILAKGVDFLTSPFAPLLVLALSGGSFAYFRSPENRRRLVGRASELAVTIPAFERLMAKARALRMLEILGLLLDSGGTVDNALRFMLESTSDERGRRELQQVRSRVMQGEDFAVALKSTGYFPPLVCSLLDVGHETGRMVEMAKKGAELCEEDVRLAIETSSSLIEPILLAGSGLVAGVAIITSATPMITLLQRL